MYTYEVAQALLNYSISRGSNTAEQCRKVTRSVLERIRSGTASQDETILVAQAINRLVKQAKPRSNSAIERQAYTLSVIYLTPERLSQREVSQIIGVDYITVHRDIKAGIELLSIQLFGIDAIDWK